MTEAFAPPAKPGTRNHPFVDDFTFAHAAWGVMFGLAGVDIGKTLLVSLTWEAVEPVLKHKAPSIFPSSSIDTRENKLGDVAAWMAGWVAVNVAKDYLNNR